MEDSRFGVPNHDALSAVCRFLWGKEREGARPLLSVADPGVGVSEAKKVCVPKIGLKFPAPLINLFFCQRKIFLMWVGGLVGQGWPGP